MAAARLTGLMSGMDTESLITQLVEARKVKVTNTINAQTKLSWKQDAWKSLNTQINKLFSGTLSNMRYQSTYAKKTTSVSNSNTVSVITGANAVNSVQSLKIDHLAKSAYLTGSQLGNGKAGYTSSTKLTASPEEGGLGFEVGSKIQVAVGGETKEITITEDTTIGKFVSSLQEAGLNASFDATNQRFFISSKSTGADQNFTLTGMNVGGMDALDALGISSYSNTQAEEYQAIIDSKDTLISKAITEKIATLSTERLSLLEKQTSHKALLTDKYSTLFEGIDLNDMTAVQTKIEELENSNEEAYAQLSNWVDTNREIENKITDIESKLTISGTAEEPAYGLSIEETAVIEAEVAEVVAQAQAALDSLGTRTGTAANHIQAADAQIQLNGVIFTSNNNTFEINGLTITANGTTAEGEEITLTTQDDTEGIYDMIKDFFKEYNALIIQMDKLYNADSAKGYEPLTDEEKADLSDNAIEEWEGKIKDSILRKDSSLNDMSSAMKTIMASGVKVNGKTLYLSDFGINTQSYFEAADNEKNAYHIDGDGDNSISSGNADILKGKIASDPELVMDFFTELSRTLYDKMNGLMKGSENRTSFSAYDDKQMQRDYDNYTSKIKELEEKLADYEDKWYAKFAAMETALAKMQSNASAVTSLLGGSS